VQHLRARAQKLVPMLDVQSSGGGGLQGSGGMRPNYSCNSLAAAEQLEALMRHASSDMSVGAQGSGVGQDQGLFLNGGDCCSSHAPSTVSSQMYSQPGVPPRSSDCAMHNPFCGSQSQDSSSNFGANPFEHIDVPSTFNTSLPMLMRVGNDPASVMRAAMNENAGSGRMGDMSLAYNSSMQGQNNGLGSQHSGMGNQHSMGNQLNSMPPHMHQMGGAMGQHPQLGGGANGMGQHPQLPSGYGSQLGNVNSPLSLLYGATAMGQGNGMGMPAGGDPHSEPQAKRRFVWTSELHQRFEQACNTLGLDNAKPKSILRLMNVEGLTKANIKSHLQKYRCMVQKRQAAEAAGGGPPGLGAPSALPMSAIDMKEQQEDGFEGDAPDSPVSSSGGQVASGPAGADAASGHGAPGAQGALPTHSADVAIDDTRRLLAQGESSLHRNLEVQEETLLAQMDLQEQLSKQLQVQKRLQAEMESMVQTETDLKSSSKINEIVALKSKLQTELQSHLRMQHELLTQLNNIVLPAIPDAASADGAAEAPTAGDTGSCATQPTSSKSESAAASSVGSDIVSADGEDDVVVEAKRVEDETDDDADFQGVKRQKIEC